MTFKTGCLICGAELAYATESRDLSCSICNKVDTTSTACTNGHYICDSCHSLSANDLIEKTCVLSNEIDPVSLANLLMGNPLLKMHGPEHHFLVPAVLLTAYYNAIKKPNRKGLAIKKARQRAEKVLGGFCGFWGTCGAAIGNGLFYSVITGSTPLSAEDWKFSNLLTSHTLKSIAEHGGPRCCKRDVYLSLIKAVEFINQKMNTQLPRDNKITCEYSHLNKECLTKGCPFYKQ